MCTGEALLFPKNDTKQKHYPVFVNRSSFTMLRLTLSGYGATEPECKTQLTCEMEENQEFWH
jgi:hypothetical protein